MQPAKLTLYSVFHKPFYQPPVDFVVPIQAGRQLATQQLPMAGDDTGEHISALNPAFCELTALYWIWKNMHFDNNSYWGLCHYRRYFSIPVHNPFVSKSKLQSKPPTAAAIDAVVNEKLKAYILKQLEQHDIIVQKPKYASKKKGKILTIEAHYHRDHIEADWTLMKQTVLQLYPHYQQSLQLFCNQTTMCFANMMIASPAIWNDYLSWLFPILFTMQQQMTAQRDGYQGRAIGFIGERLLNLYLRHQQYKTAYMFITSFDQQ
jgi:hypothetical protein